MLDIEHKVMNKDRQPFLMEESHTNKLANPYFIFI